MWKTGTECPFDPEKPFNHSSAFWDDYHTFTIDITIPWGLTKKIQMEI